MVRRRRGRGWTPRFMRGRGGVQADLRAGLWPRGPYLGRRSRASWAGVQRSTFMAPTRPGRATSLDALAGERGDATPMPRLRAAAPPPPELRLPSADAPAGGGPRRPASGSIDVALCGIPLGSPGPRDLRAPHRLLTGRPHGPPRARAGRRQAGAISGKLETFFEAAFRPATSTRRSEPPSARAEAHLGRLVSTSR